MAFNLPFFTGFYHRSVEIFGAGGAYETSIAADVTGFGDWNISFNNTVYPAYFKVFLNAGYTDIYVAFHFITQATFTDVWNYCKVVMTDGKVIDFRILVNGPWIAYVDNVEVDRGTVNHDTKLPAHVEFRFDISDTVYP